MAEAFNEFLNFFLDEAVDVLSAWEKACLDIERDGGVEAKEELYRSAHNLKSGSGAVGLTEFNELVHKVEDLIAKVLSGQIANSPEAIQIFLQAHSVLSAWVERLKAGEPFAAAEHSASIFAAVDSVLGGSSPRRAAQAAESGPSDAPSPAAADLIGMHGAHILLRSVGLPPKGEAAPQVDSEAATAPPADEARTEASRPAANEAARNLGAGSGHKATESIRVAASKLDQLIQLIGELSTQQAIVWHARQNGQLQGKSSDNAIQLIQKIAKDLQGLALSLRLQPLQSLFQRLERTGRDLARSQEKKIEVAISGEHVEVDRTVIERIADAMNHIIRNAIDHGIEQPGQREAKGKNPLATLRIEAVQETSGVMLRIGDDGRGLNTDRIRNKAIERGLISAQTSMEDADIHRLIFHAGLSTAEKVTDISGRGVGMDVVKNAVETIGGTIQVSSRAHEGSMFAISLPATLSIIDALIVVVGKSRYAIPIQDVAEIIDAEQSRIDPVAGFGRLLSLREKLISVEALIAHLPAPAGQASDAVRGPKEGIGGAAMHAALIVRCGGDSLAFEVDAIIGQQPVTVRPLPHLIAGIPGYTGGTILGDGEACVILNLAALVTRHFDRISRSPMEPRHEGLEGAAEPQADSCGSIESRYLIFETHGQALGAPLLSIKEILQDLPCQAMVGSAPHLLGCIDVRGCLLPVYDLGVILGLPPGHGQAATDIVIEDEGRPFALRVQRICAVADVKAMESEIADRQKEIIPGLHGYIGTGLHKGQPIPMIDLQKALRAWEGLLPIHSQKLSGSHLEAS